MMATSSTAAIFASTPVSSHPSNSSSLPLHASPGNFASPETLVHFHSVLEMYAQFTMTLLLPSHDLKFSFLEFELELKSNWARSKFDCSFLFFSINWCRSEFGEEILWRNRSPSEERALSVTSLDFECRHYSCSTRGTCNLSAFSTVKWF